MSIRASAFPFAFAAMLVLTACDATGQRDAGGKTTAITTTPAATVAGASVRLNANPAAPSAAYFTLTGGATARALTGVSSAEVERAELHESRMEGGMMRMAPIPEVPVPAGGTVEFRPGGKHVMLFGISDAARAAGKLTLTLNFRDGQSLPVEVPLSAVGAEAAAADEHQGH